MRRLRKHIATVVVAGMTAGVTALVLGGGSAVAFHTDHKAYYRRSASTAIGAGSSGSAQADCPTGTKIIGGGAYTTGAQLVLEASFPSSNASTTSTGFKAWTAWAHNFGASNQDLTAYAICAVAGRNSSYPGGINADA